MARLMNGVQYSWDSPQCVHTSTDNTYLPFIFLPEGLRCILVAYGRGLKHAEIAAIHDLQRVEKITDVGWLQR